jgi:dipeptidyl aminopeptidase/acylaminoacyl peptidase
VLHGRNDVRVPVTESEQIVEAAGDAELLIFEDEGHGIVKHANMARGYGRAVEFLVEKIGSL